MPVTIMIRRLACFALPLVLAIPASSVRGAGKSTDDERVVYEKHVRPILKAHCFHCHGEDGERKRGLDLRLRRFIVEGGKSGPAIVPGEPDESLLLERISKGEMPPGENPKLSDEQVAVIRRWIAQGAETARPEPKEIGSGMLITHADRQHWSFQPIRRPSVPPVEHAGRVRNPVDAFLLDRLEEKELSFAPEADKRTLLRRACFDLLGLPPTPEQIERFLADDSPGAYERLIDRLLASPHYGERWGRHWLDVAGYADSEGYTNEDPERKWAYKYRDYVIRAFNADKPFDEFIREQLAGDEMVEPPYENLTAEETEKLVATGFLRMAPDGTGTNGVDRQAAGNDVIAETIKIVSGSLLGMTVGCAQCHNHRYDPIPQADYYRMRAIFDPAYNWKDWRQPEQRLVSLYSDADRQQAKKIEAEARKVLERRKKKQQEFIQQTFEKELKKLPEKIRPKVRKAYETPGKKRTAEQKKLLKEHPSVNVTAGSLYLYDREAADKLEALEKKAREIRQRKPEEEFVRALTEVPGRVPESHVYNRGDYEQPKEPVEPAGLTVLQREGTGDAIPVNDPSLPTTGRRLAFAKHLTSGRHPLTARVLVNRAWLHHFGRGIVETPGNFGELGAEPTHPRLLDWLASEFMDNGWSLKHVHRLIMTSTAYRQGHAENAAKRNIDPENRLYGRREARRLEAEVIRDAMLAISGKLNPKPFGEPVPVMADRTGQYILGIENLNAGRPGDWLPMHGEQYRRSVYVQARRSRPLAVLASFDWPAMSPNCEARASSTVAPQSLLLMNNRLIVAQSEYFAKRVRQEAGQERDAQVRRAWELAYGREPSKQELQDAIAFLQKQTEYFQENAPPKQNLKKLKKRGRKPHPTDPELLGLASLCQAIFSSNEFLYIE